MAQALSSAGIDLSSLDEKALSSGATELAGNAAGLASSAATDAITTAGSFSGEVWTPLGLGVIGAAALGAAAEREDVVGTARPAGLTRVPQAGRPQARHAARRPRELCFALPAALRVPSPL